MDMIDEHHRRHSAELLGEEDGVELASEPPRMPFGLQTNGKPISSAKTMQLRRTANISTDSEQRKVTCTEKMNSLLGGGRTFEEEYGARLDDVR